MISAELRAFCSAFWQIDEVRVVESLKLDDSELPNFNSIRYFQFLTAIESNFDVEIDDVTSIKTIKDLLIQMKKK